MDEDRYIELPAILPLSIGIGKWTCRRLLNVRSWMLFWLLLVLTILPTVIMVVVAVLSAFDIGSL